MIQILRASTYRNMLWKNGTGYTLELARQDNEALGTFDWRVSMADVTTSGAFSLFDGMQRVLTVLEGAGIILTMDDAVPQRLALQQSVAFSGSSKVSCELIDGPIRDFNLIYNPQRYSARYQWIQNQEHVELFSSANILFMFNHAADKLNVVIDGEHVVLQTQESLKIAKNTQVMTNITLPEGVSKHCCLIELSPI